MDSENENLKRQDTFGQFPADTSGLYTPYSPAIMYNMNNQQTSVNHVTNLPHATSTFYQMPSVKKIHSSPNKNSAHYDFSQKRVFEERSVEQSNVQTPAKKKLNYVEKESSMAENNIQANESEWYKESPNIMTNVF